MNPGAVLVRSSNNLNPHQKIDQVLQSRITYELYDAIGKRLQM